jgi:uncharacterized OsmC-like protein
MKRNLNGWDLDAVEQAVEGVRQEPAAGHLTWRNRVTWDGGFGLDVRTRDITQLDQVIPRHFTMRGDHPAELLGDNTGPTAVETLLGALGACVAGTFASQATARGIELHELQVDVEAAIDLAGFFGLRPVQAGLSQVKVDIRARADAPDGKLQEVLDAVRQHSPVFDTITRPVEIEAVLSLEGATVR